MIKRATTFSPCRKYRYALWREWTTDEMFEGSNDGERGIDALRQFVMFIGLNPSTADETKDDPTIRKCIGFAKRWGFGALCMTNLFAFRATDPRVMKREEHPVGDDNLRWIGELAAEAGMIVAAWGVNGTHYSQGWTVQQCLKGEKLFCLRTTKDGHPEHPLYVPYETKPILLVAPQPQGAPA